MHSCFSNFEKKTLFLFTRQSLIQRNYWGKLNCGLQSSAAEYLLDGGATNDEIDEITLSVSLYISQSLYLSLSLSLNLSIFISFSILFSFSFSLLRLLYVIKRNMALKKIWLTDVNFQIMKTQVSENKSVLNTTCLIDTIFIKLPWTVFWIPKLFDANSWYNYIVFTPWECYSKFLELQKKQFPYHM